MKQHRPILISGAHRSGTTWVGKTIALDRNVSYIHEPFNINTNRGLCYADFKYWFTYINDHNEKYFYNEVEDMLKFKYKITADLSKIKNDIRRSKNTLKNYLKYFYSRNMNFIPLIKDPIAIFSADWLYRNFNFNVIITIRHPAAFASSLMRLKFNHPFDHFIKQEELMSTFDYKQKRLIEEYSRKEQPIIKQACLLWDLIYSRVLHYQKIYDEWYFIKHEDISKNPLKEFEKIFIKLNLNYIDKVKKKIKASSNAYNPKYMLGSETTIKLNSMANIKSWKKKLSKEEIKQIKKATFELSSNWYTLKDW